VLTVDEAFETRYGHRELASSSARALFRPRFVEHRDVYARSTQCVTLVLPAGAAGWPDLGTVPFTVDDSSFAETARELVTEMSVPRADSAFVLEGLSALVVARLQGCEPRERAPWLRRLRAWLDDACADPPSLSVLARALDRDPAYVAAAFRRSFGLTIGRYVRRRRAWHARALLRDRSASLAEIAQRTGFADQSHFTRCFRAELGVTPGAYRARIMR